MTHTDAIPEVDMWELDAELYRIWKLLERADYGKAQNKTAALWFQIHQFNVSEPETGGPTKPRLKSTQDRNFVALLLKFAYWLLNLLPRRCQKFGYWCEYVYPYGFVPEGGCPIHD